ncbi:STAS domain-containing protein, partial [Roseomonas sp. DSM 102946]|nr:STAS domain-containing protein [Roseomonas sp. DSM 102946]
LAAHPRLSSLVMLATVAVVVVTHNLAMGVFVGVLLSGVFFAFKVMRLMQVEKAYDEAGRTRTYRVKGQVFFASAEMFADAFDLRDAVARQVVIDLTGAHLWDITAVGALEGVVNKMRRHGLRVEVVGLNEASAGMVERHGRFSPAEM